MTRMRMPRIHGLPPHWPGLKVIRSLQSDISRSSGDQDTTAGAQYGWLSPEVEEAGVFEGRELAEPPAPALLLMPISPRSIRTFIDYIVALGLLRQPVATSAKRPTRMPGWQGKRGSSGPIIGSEECPWQPR